jgi:anti-sigma factor RsiW
MSGYLDGELASRGRVRLERHVGECEECRRVLAGLREMLAQLGGLPSPPARRDRRGIAASVRQRLHDG